MDLKQKICEILQQLNYKICPDFCQSITNKFQNIKHLHQLAIAKNIEMKTELTEIARKYTLALKNNEVLKLEVDVLQKAVKENLCVYESEAKYWNEKRPFANIVYNGRILPGTDKKIATSVQLFITARDPVILRDIEMYGLKVEDPLNCNEKILEIYKHTRKKPLNRFRYKKDIETVGVPEFWYFPFELRFAKEGDCDDWGNELASYLIAAGVPRFRVRCVAGNTWGLGGHLTVYVLGDDMKTWHHLNSTTPFSQITQESLEEFPKTNDKKDLYGIRDVWFSYNDKFSWSEFETSADVNKNSNRMKDIEIKILR